MNYRAIQPVSIWTETGFRNASRLRLSNFGNYNFDGGGGNVNWYLDEVTIQSGVNQVPVLDQDGNQTYDEQGNPIYNEVPYEVENTSPLAWSINPMNIPSEVVQQWGEDDTPIFEYVASQLSDINIILL